MDRAARQPLRDPGERCGDRLAGTRGGDRQRTVFGHRATVGARVGDLCELGNATILMPGSRLGNGCILGEGTLVPAGAVVPDDTVLVGDGARAPDRHRGRPRTPRRPARRPDRPDPSSGHHRPHAIRGRRPRASSTPTATRPLGSPTRRCCRLGGNQRRRGGRRRLDHRRQSQDHRIAAARSGSAPGSRSSRTRCCILLPDNELVVEDDVVIGPGAMIHGCRLGAATVIAIVCDSAVSGGSRSSVRGRA
jgi:carbonic anhydrase/acetyltransferase-like protein (isoleucine patch superfamily)